MRHRPNDILPPVTVAAIEAEVLNPGDNGEPLKKSMHRADVISDRSASTAAARHLALDCLAPVRRAWMLLNPSGYMLVIPIEKFRALHDRRQDAA
jgi:hypothetical protein